MTRAQTWDPALYTAHASFVHRLPGDLVDLLAPVAGERILDLGCGTGELTAAIAALGAAVLGVDSSAEMVAEARRRFPGVSFAIEDGEALPHEAAFDAIFSNAALHWMRRADATARGMARALRPGGRLIAELGGAGCVSQVREGVTTVLARMGEPAAPWLPWYFPSLAEYVALLAAAGFDVRFAHLFDRPTPLDGDHPLAAWLRTFLSPLVTHLGAKWDDFALAVEEACAPKLRHDGRWVLDYVRLRIVARIP